MFSSTRLANEVTHFVSKRLDGSEVTIICKYIKEVSMTEQSSLQILNLILRRGMEGLKLQLVGRNFFDAISKIPINEFRLELWLNSD